MYLILPPNPHPIALCLTAAAFIRSALRGRSRSRYACDPRIRSCGCAGNPAPPNAASRARWRALLAGFISLSSAPDETLLVILFQNIFRNISRHVTNNPETWDIYSQ